MKLRKNPAARLAVEAQKSVSAVIKARLLAGPSGHGEGDEYWPGPALKPLTRPRDARGAYLKRKHGR